MLPGKSFSPSELLQMAKRRAWLIAIPPFLALFGALIYSSKVPELYQSQMLVAIIPQRLPDSYVRSTVTLRTEERLDAIAVDVMSRGALEQLMDDFDLYPEERAELAVEDVIGILRANLEVGLEPARRGPRGPEPPHAFHVGFRYTNPQVAAAVTERVGNLFVEQNVKDRGALARATSDFLEDQLNDARKRLEQQEQRLEVFRQRYGNELPTQMQMNLQAMQSTQMQVQALVEAIARDRDRKQMLERLYRETLNEPPTVVAAPVAQPSGSSDPVPATGSTQQQLDTARASLASLELRYTGDHPDIVRTKRLIAELEPKAAAEAAAAAKAAASTEEPVTGTPAVSGDPARRESLRQMLAEIESLDRQTAFKESEERRLRASILEYQRRIEAVPGVESEWVKLSRDYDTLQAAYKELLNKAGNAKVAVDLEDEQIGEQFRIVESAGVPVHPLPSNRPLINLGGLVLGLLLGLGLAAFLELRDSSFRTDADVLEVLELPVLASVPQVLSDSERRRGRRRQFVLSALAATGLAVISYLTWSWKLWTSVI